MRRCWAACLGDCAGGLSGEHLVSKGILTGRKRIQVVGDLWRASEPKYIGANSLTANILCRKHNSDLSDVDSEGIGVFRALREFEEIFSGRMPVNPFKLYKTTSGPLFERWCLKHLVNICVAASGEQEWYNGSPIAEPPIEVVKSAFGIEALAPPRGLYTIMGEIGQKRVIGDQVGIESVTSGGQKVVAGIITIQALTFLLSLVPSQIRISESIMHYRHMGCIFQSEVGTARWNVKWPV